MLFTNFFKKTKTKCFIHFGSRCLNMDLILYFMHITYWLYLLFFYLFSLILTPCIYMCVCMYLSVYLCRFNCLIYHQSRDQTKKIPFLISKNLFLRITFIHLSPKIIISQMDFRIGLYPGWFNSIASVVKRRFASYVKSHLGDGGNNKKDRENYVQHPMQPTSPYHFEKLRTQFPTTSASASMPSSPHFGNRAEQHYERERLTAMSPRLLNNVDRRHRSPDPPPR